MKLLLTGIAGFIGFHTAKKLIENDDTIIGIDNINDYYDVNLKYSRLAELGIQKIHIAHNNPVQSNLYKQLTFLKLDLEHREHLIEVFKDNRIDVVIHLAAQAGVRYSLTNPHAYMDSNIQGFMNILEACRHHKVKHLVYASSSSVYGLNENMPFSTHHNVDHPVSLYAASKKANELMAHTYSHLYRLPTTGLRFFTVYGPWGRPDMALFIFTKAILEDRPIDVFNNGDMQRDFTYVDDIVEGVIRVSKRIPAGDPAWSGSKPDPSTSKSPYKIYNIGNNAPVRLMEFIESIENAIGKKAKKNFLPMQPGDVQATYADVTDLVNDTGYRPATPVREGIDKFIKWYRSYYKI